MNARANSKANWTLALTSIVSLMAVLDALVVTTALPTIRRDLHASVPELEWTVNAYVLSFAVLLMSGAALGDRLGRRRLFVAGIGLFCGASAGCALAQSVGWLIAARAVQGAGAALMMPLGLALLSAAFAPQQRAKALGSFSAVNGFGGALGPLLGGAAVQLASWPWVFWINVPIGLLAIVFARRKIQESFGPNTTLDLPGLALVTGGAFGIVWALARGNTTAWGSSEIAAALAGGVALTTAFVGWEIHSSNPMLPMRLFRSVAFSVGSSSIFFLWGAALAFLFLIAQYLQLGLRFAPVTAGACLLPFGAPTAVAGVVAGARIRRHGERPFLVGGLLLAAAGAGSLALLAKPNLPYWQMVVPLIFTGVGLAMAVVAAQSSAMTHVAAPDIGRASGAFTTLRQLGGAFGIAVAVAVFTSAGSYASPTTLSNGLGPGLGVVAGLALIGAAAGLRAPNRRAQAEPALADKTPIATAEVDTA